MKKHERVWDYDWIIHDEIDENGLPQTVPATEILHVSDIRVIAVCLHGQEGKPIYMMGLDHRLYYHHYSDGFINQLIPMDDFLKWKNYWFHSEWWKKENPSVSLPKGWFIERIIGETILFISDDIIDTYREAVQLFRSENNKLYFTSYDIYKNFPRVIERALRLKEKRT